MRVLFLTDSLSDLDGVGRYTMRLIGALERLEPGLEVRILLARRHRPTSSSVPAHWKVQVALPPDYFFHMSPARFWPSLVRASWSVAAAARGCDLVHAIKDYPHSLAGTIGARLAGKPCVATAHGTYSVQPLLEARHRKLAEWMYGRLDGLVAVSRYTAQRLEELLPPSVRARLRLIVIPNAVEAGHYRAPRELAGERPWHGVPFTLSIGELKERKGHHLALEGWIQAAARFPELHHFVVGKGSSDDYQRGLLARCDEAGVGQRVHFLGNVDEAEKVDLLQRAQVFLHTPVTASGGGFEGFGIVYLEAAASGTPAIGTLDSGAQDALVDGVTGLLVAQDPVEVSDALARLLADAELRARLGAAGRRHAESSSWDANARLVLALYRKVLARRGGRRPLEEARGPGGAR
jgi:glycosyltransferase involved in cell wall biosynthesis